MAPEGTAKLNSVQSAAILFYPSHFSVLWLGVRRRSPPMAVQGWAFHGPIALRGSLFSFALLLSHTSRIIDSYRLSSEPQLFYKLTSPNEVGSEDGRKYKLFLFWLLKSAHGFFDSALNALLNETTYNETIIDVKDVNLN